MARAIGSGALGVTRLLVVALATTILIEPAVDVKCHSFAPARPAQVPGDTALPANGADDPCGPTCVPDCYCCSTPLVAAVVFDPPSAVPVTVSEVLPARPLEGVVVVPHLPPIA